MEENELCSMCGLDKVENEYGWCNRCLQDTLIENSVEVE